MIFICRICFHLLRVGSRMKFQRDVRRCAFCNHELEDFEDELQ
jgi:hypothetical protein